MTTREQQFKEAMLADATLVALLTGGIYTDEEIGIEGLHRGDIDPSSSNYSLTAAAFDERGELLPCAVIRQGGVMPYGNTQNPSQQISGTAQRVEVFFYQNRRYTVVDAARERNYFVLQGKRLSSPGSYPITWMADSPYYYDVGPVANSVTTKQDWMVVSMRKPA